MLKRTPDPKVRAALSTGANPLHGEAVKPTSGCGECGARFTTGITRRFGVALAAVSGRASECCGERMWRSCPTRAS
ncbi:hypothetical protein [Desulfosporosinus orientis]|uniref:hypothetical protein n=1 Tax=Desulfosporosinus orientis TaxID=1563 RepID=UPI0011D2221F|nr:hypothetical protein [Desulfosporosinus orientis]